MAPVMAILIGFGCFGMLYSMILQQNHYSQTTPTDNKILTQNNLMKNDTRNATIYSPSRIQVLCGNDGGYDDDRR